MVFDRRQRRNYYAMKSLKIDGLKRFFHAVSLKCADCLLRIELCGLMCAVSDSNASVFDAVAFDKDIPPAFTVGGKVCVIGDEAVSGGVGEKGGVSAPEYFVGHEEHRFFFFLPAFIDFWVAFQRQLSERVVFRPVSAA